ncbi:thiamine transporter [Halanaerobium saccharolyticum]|jgi:thiamine transporter|uniref:Thiamine transporter n=1 Tax=Halanaerobium saccharolyticum TaxID=43595 RepID=A0A4V6Q857_9FIRM|nr:energy-coupled thiamine transporter ThiT [Halanaerobium saccharolyticum]RAK08106.1 thiamine transporter [Halanaerobium saccharolyticum]TDW04313.1 thiamine transporter [Halanaerobium saccharolyticum]TDX59604.1 thiamine transporter [Halanaerobium saccharolyticum]
MQNKFSTRMMAEIGVAVALAVVLNFLKLWRMPQGGSVTLEMLPIFVIAFRWGLGAGMFSGLAYGLLQLMFGAYIIHPVQLIMDYPLPYMVLGVAGMFKIRKDKIIQPLKMFWAVVVASALRLIVHIISGVIFFSSYAPEGQNVWVYSTVYNATFLIPTTIVTYIVLIMVMKALENK